MRESTKEWLAAGVKLSTDPAAKVLCPANNDDYLIIEDAPADAEDTFDRYLRCPKCGAMEILVRMGREQS